MAKEQEKLIVITKTYDLILWNCKHMAEFPRNQRFVLGEQFNRTLYGICINFGIHTTPIRQSNVAPTGNTVAQFFRTKTGAL